MTQKNKIVTAFDIILRGYSQVMLQNNPLTGLLFFVAIALGAFHEDLLLVAYGGFLGTIVSTLSAFLITQDHEGIEAGLYGYNGCLVGAALPTFLAASPLLWASIIFGALISSLFTIAINQLFRVWKLPALTAPFVLTIWTLLLAAYAFPNINWRIPLETISIDEAGMYLSPLDMLISSLHGFSEVFLVSSILMGLLLLLGLAVASLWVMLWAVLGALIAILTVFLLGTDLPHITNGLYVYSAILTAITLGSLIQYSNWRLLSWIIIAIVLTVIIQGALNTLLHSLKIPVLTMPFVIVCWLFLFIFPSVKFKEAS